jgi:hypothetical protein
MKGQPSFDDQSQVDIGSEVAHNSERDSENSNHILRDY